MTSLPKPASILPTPDATEPFAAYLEVSPLQPGWRERAPLVYLRELLSLLAHFPDRAPIVQFVMPLIEHVIAAFG